MKLINDIKVLLGLLILTIIVGINGYLTNRPINENDLVTVKGTLEERPYLGDQGGDMPRRYIRFKLLEDSKKYYLIDCTYDVSNKTEILNLLPGSKVVFFVRNHELDKEKIYPYGLYSEDHKAHLLKLNNYNRCHTKKWKRLMPISLVIVLILSYKIYRNYKK